MCCLELCDVPGHQFGDAIDGVISNSGEDMAEIELRVKSVELGGSDERVEGGGAFAAPVRSSEEIVFRPSATTRNARSVALLSISTAPSSR